jgi:5-methylthioadenosine/S-adenosylhomocysteine deaminase
VAAAAALRETAELIRAWKPHARVDVWPYPVVSQQCSDELMADCARLAEQLDVGVATHLHETEEEVERWRAETGRSPIAHYHDRGNPLLGPRTNAGHLVHVDARDVEIVAETGLVPVHNPMTNGGLGAGLAPIPAMLAAGIPVALGIDDGPADMFEAMKTALLFQKVAAQDSQVMRADAALTMATRNGARALLLEDAIGSLEVGKRGDVVVLDLAKPHTTPVSPPLPAFLTYCATPENVDTVVIDGRVVMRGRELTLLDEREVVAKAQAVMDRIVRSGALDASAGAGARA